MATKNKKIQLKDIETYIPNFLQDQSPRLIDIFMILGYESIYIIEQMIKDIKSDENKKPKDTNEFKENLEQNETINDFENIQSFKKYQCKEYPTVLSSVTSDLDSGEENYFFSILDFQFYLELCLSKPPLAYYTKDKQNMNKDLIKPRQLIPYIVNNEAINSCYSYMFYEEKEYDKIFIYIPKIFCIVSKYRFYKIFNEICVDIYEIFKSSIVQIPLEVQIYNIINHTPAPSDSKLQLHLFPYQDFNLKKLNSPNFFNNSKLLDIPRLSGYTQNQINFGWIFNIFSVETIIEIYLELRIYTNISFFSSDIEKLFILLNIFNTLLYPILDEESAIITNFKDFLNPQLGKSNYFYYGIEIDNLKQAKEFFENKEKEIPKLYPNFYILLEDEEKKLISTYEEIPKTKKNNRINSLHNLLIKIIYEQEDLKSYIEQIIKPFKISLNNINNEIKRKSLCLNYYELNNEEIEINIKIRNIFYKLNLDLSNFIYMKQEKIKNLEASKLNKRGSKILEINSNVDEIFYENITKCFYADILRNFCNKKDETSKNMKLPRKIFAAFLSDLRCNPDENREINYFRIIDSIYYHKNPGKLIKFNFLDFYGYFYNQLDKYFSEVINSKFLECKLEENEPNKGKHYYTYKKIEIDPELIMKYLCVLERMEDESLKKEKEKILPKENLFVPKSKTRNIDIFNEIEKYYIENNLLKNKEIIRICLIYYIILTIPKKNIVFFNKENKDITPGNDKKTYNNFMYDIFNNNKLFSNKYIEMFLSVSYRYFNNTNETNYFLIQPYIELYDNCVIKRNLLKNEEMTSLYNKFKEFSDKIKEYNTPTIIKNENNIALINHDVNYDYYNFTNKIGETDLLLQLDDNSLEGKLIDEKINMNCNYEPKMLSLDCIYSPKAIYGMIQKIMKDFYLKINNVDNIEDSLKEIGLNLLFYCYILRNDENILTKEISKYILFNLNNK